MNKATRSHGLKKRNRMVRGTWFTVITAIFFLSVLAVAPGAGTSTDLHIVKLASDGYTVLEETHVTWQWMENNLPVQGDGSTHYYLQGPVFVENAEDRWNPAEDTNVQEKDMGAVKGTDVRDLCELVGGMSEGDVLTVKASDGFSREFAYENVYSPPSRQGPLIIAWYQAGPGYVPSYQDGMRLLFLADTSSNPWGIHAMGAWDWHESAEERYWYYYYDGTERYPTTTGLSVRSVSELSIASHEEPAGSIHVTSDPEGAEILLDSVETGLTTPCTIPGLFPGPYMVGVTLEGYDTPKDQEVEVVHGQTAEAGFVLEKSGNAGSAMADSGDSQLFTGAVTSGSLPLSAEGTVQGELVVIPLHGLGGTIQSGETHTAALDLPAENLTPVRLCIFSAGYSNPRNPVSTEPGLLLEIDGTTLPPSSTVSDQSADADAGRIATTSWDLSGMAVGEDPAITLTMKDDPAAKCMVRGGVLVAGVQGEPGIATRYRIFEGADATTGTPGVESPESETLFGFVPLTGTVSDEAMLVLVATGDARDSAPQFRVQLNEDILTGSFSPAADQVWIGEVTISPPVAGSRVSGSLRTMFPDDKRFFGENREVILMVRGMNGTGQKENASEMISVSPVETGFSSATLFPTATVTYSASGITRQDQDAQFSGTPLVAPPPKSVLDRIIDAIFSFIFAITGAPPISYENSSEPGTYAQPGPTREVTGPQEVTIGSSENEGVKNGTNQESGQVLKPTPTPVEEYEEPLVSPAGGERITPYGGLYLESLPSEITLKIDNNPVSLHLPCVVYGLRSGSHFITADLAAVSGQTGTTRTFRAWIYPGAMMPVRLDLIGVNDFKTTRILTRDGRTVSFTVDGRYPVRKTPTEVDMESSGSFITALENDAYLSFSIPPAFTDHPEIIIPDIGPGLHVLVVESSPVGAEVFIDGIRTELTTPCQVENLSEGLHRVTVSLPGYIPGESVIDIPINKEPLVKDPARFTLDRYAWGDLEVRSEVEGADIFLDGFPTSEKTPATLRFIPIGVHEVTIRLGDRTRASDVTVIPGETAKCRVTLE